LYPSKKKSLLNLRYITILLLCLWTSPLTSQTSSKQAINDSLYNRYLFSESADKKIALLAKLVDRTFYTKHRKEATLKYIEEAEKIPSENLTNRGLHIQKYIRSWKHEHYNEFDKKIELLEACVDFFKEKKHRVYYFKSRYYLGELFFRTGRYESALKYLSKLKEKLPVDHPLYSIAIRKLVRTYSNLNQNETALEIISKLADDYESRSDFKWDGQHMRHYLVKAMILSRLGKTTEAIKFTEKVKYEAEKSNSVIILNNCKSELAKYYLTLSQTAKAKKLATEAYDHYDVLKMNYPSMTSTRVTLGNIFLKEGDYLSASKYFKEAIELAKIHHRLYDHKNAMEGLVKCNIHLAGDKETILDQLETYNILKDSLVNEDMNLTVQDIRVKYETEKKETELEQLNKENLAAKENLKIARRNNFFLIGGLLFLLLSALLLGYLYRSKLKAQRLLQEQKQIIEISLKEKQLLLKEIHHRVKNNLQTVSSLLSLQSNYIKDDKVLKALKEGQNRVQSMALIHQNLYQDDNLRSISVRTYFDKLIKGLYDSYNIDPARIKLNLDIDDLLLDVETVVPIGLITNELVSNVFKYAFPADRSGELDIRLTGDKPLVLIVKDNGLGMDKQLLQDNNDTFGYQMIRAFCSKLNAELSISSENGTEIKIEIENNTNEENTNRRR